ncbi:MAG: PspC domain-containing protein [Bacteroidetes bacterium]|nr:PspC domain-containing protein [Bacteroidota bacterium]
MNKTISVNISGLMFVLDEEAYTRLNQYMHELRAHFAGRSGQEEIISDIESRIAELFQQYVNEQKQVIELAEVEHVIAVLGQPWQMDGDASGSAETESKKAEPGAGAQSSGSRRLYRDVANAKLAGVAAGLGNYFRIDPLVPRILFVILLFASGVGPLVYIIMWALMPVMPSSGLEGRPGSAQSGFERSAYRQFFRDPENKKLAGIAAGLGHYFNVDPLIFRLLFVIFTLISGIGLIAYVVLWVITPEALSTADKLKMKGQPVNVENIERNIREEAERLGRKMNQMGAEAGQGLRNAGRQAGPYLGSFVKTLLRILSILVGVVFFIVGTALLAVTIAFISGWDGFVFFEDLEIPVSLSNMANLILPDPSLAQLGGIALGGFVLIPLAMFVYVALQLIIGHNFRLPGLGHIAGVLWVLSVVGLGYTGYKLGSDFREKSGTELVNQKIEVANQVVVHARDAGKFKGEPMLVIENQRFMFDRRKHIQKVYAMPHFYIQTSKPEVGPALIVEAIASGEDEDLARQRSRSLDFPIEFRNDTLYIPVWFGFDAQQGLRAQRINVHLNLPDSTRVQFSPELDGFFADNPRNFWRSRPFAGSSKTLINNDLQ